MKHYLSLALLLTGAVGCNPLFDPRGTLAPTQSLSPTPTPSSTPTTVSALSVSDQASCAVLSNNAIKCWGLDPSTIPAFNGDTPVIVSGPGSVSFSSGRTTAHYFIHGGKLYGFGLNDFGQLSDATMSTAASNFSGISDLSAGLHHACVVSSGSVYCVGDDSKHQVAGSNNTTAVPNISGATRVTAAYEHSCAIVSGGQVYCWGRNNVGQVNGNANDVLIWPGDTGAANVQSLVPNISNATAISSGSGHNCVIISGQVYCWGDNYHNRLGGSSTTTAVPNLTGVTAITSGEGFTCALSGGKVYCWGENNWDQLGGSDVSTVPATPVSGLTQVTAIAAGKEHMCAISDSGASVHCWGRNDNKQIGNSDTTTRALTQVAVP